MGQPIPITRQCLEIMAFAKEKLGVDIYGHKGQVRWLNESHKMVNILRPGNQWGKTLILAIKHIYHAMTKYELRKFHLDSKDPLAWLKAEYTTLNFGKTYEIAKSVHEAILALVAGEYTLVNPATGEMYMNESKIKSAIVYAYDKELPYIEWWNNAVTLTRSTDDMGSAFKRRRLAFVSGDEVGDITDLINVLNATVMPRVAFYQGKIDLIGTPQDPGDYSELIEMAEDHMEKHGDLSQYFVQQGSMYENPGLSEEYIKQIEGIADQNLKDRIVYGDIAASGERYFTLNEVMNAIQGEYLNYNEETGIIESPLTEEQAKAEKALYVVSVDYAASEDRTVLGVVRYDVKPARLVFCRYFKGKEVPIPMQYQITREVYRAYEKGAYRIKLIFDANALGGQNAKAQLRDLHGMEFPGKGISPADAKANALGALKALFDEGRKVIEKDGETIDVNPSWGGFWLPNIRLLRTELEGYKLKDDKIRNDFVVMLAQAAYYIAKRRPKDETFRRIRDIGEPLADRRNMFLNPGSKPKLPGRTADTVYPRSRVRSIYAYA